VASALDARDGDDYAGNAETLLIMMQQHNVKEENVLYPMCDQHLADQLDALLPEAAEPDHEQTRPCRHEAEPAADIVIDARGLEPPEPMVRTMEALDRLADQQKLLVLLPREPYPLYRALEVNGFSWQAERRSDGTVEVLIRASRSSNAGPAVLRQAPPLAAPFRFFLTAPLFAILAGLLDAVERARSVCLALDTGCPGADAPDHRRVHAAGDARRDDPDSAGGRRSEHARDLAAGGPVVHAAIALGALLLAPAS
jgi:tRNA 2-thiouridine synthesizing protein A